MVFVQVLLGLTPYKTLDDYRRGMEDKLRHKEVGRRDICAKILAHFIANFPNLANVCIYVYVGCYRLTQYQTLDDYRKGMEDKLRHKEVSPKLCSC